MTRVCNNCVKDPILSGEIKEQGKYGICDNCGKPGETTVLKDLAERIHHVLQEHFRLTPGYPEEPMELFLYKEDKWERRGDPTDILISDIAGLDEPISEELVSLLSEKHTYEEAKDGVENPYDSDAMYEEHEAFDVGFLIAWNEFQKEIQSKSRFFSATAENVLANIFEGLDALGTRGNPSIIRIIDPDDQDGYVWRGRAAHSRQELADIVKAPVKELGPPPPHAAKAGRMNADGISVFYGALEKSTCISELRPPVGSSVIIGKFNVIRSVKLLDLGALADAYVNTSYFDSKFLEHKSRAAFLKNLVNEISRPVAPKDEGIEYLATQVVAEFLAHKASPTMDGIIFPSSQTEGKGWNVVLFNHARTVEAYDLPVNSTIEVSFPSGPPEDYEDMLDEAIFVDETVPSNPSGGEPPPSKETKRPLSTAHFIEYLLQEPDDDPESTLQLDVDNLEVFETTGITYSTNSRWLIRTRETEDERNAGRNRISEFVTIEDSEEDLMNGTMGKRL